jgi:AraC family transcriptional regulator of adaptative response / DNA-3-methyladenine glycosylase II
VISEPDPAGPRPHPIELRLSYLAPFDGSGLVAFLGLRAAPGVEEVTGDGVYRRSLSLPGGVGIVELAPADDHVQAHFWLEDPDDLEVAADRSRALLDLDADPTPVLDTLASDPLIGQLVRATPGRRVPGHVDGDELAIRAVLGQQVSLAGANTLAARLVVSAGQPLTQPVGTLTHRFPSAAQIAAVDPESLAMPNSRRVAVLTLARALADGTVQLHPGADPARTRRQLLNLPGIGRWTADYVAMRALGDPDVFLSTDLGVRHALEALGVDAKPRAADKLAERWRPFRSYAVVHLWAHLATTSRSTARTPTPG